MRHLAWALLALSTAAAFAQPVGRPWRDQWDSYEYSIPMRDGVKLMTVVYVPKNHPGNLPILMERTCYGAGNMNAAPRRSTPSIVEAGYILAFQDVRGKGRSEGDFVNVRPTLKKGQKGIDESTDTYDTVDYLIKNVPRNSQRVGLWGISYPGFYAGAGAIRNHPALKAVSPQAPVNDWFMGDDVHHHGVLFAQESFDFGLGFNVPRGGERPQVTKDSPAYEWYLNAGAPATWEAKYLKGKIPYWQELIDNDTLNGYWKDRILWRSFKDVGCAVLTVGGWFDKEDMYGALKLYEEGEKANPKSANFLVMGPWSHGGWARQDGSSLAGLPWGSNTSQWFQQNVELPFFERFLKGKDQVAAPNEATMFETGTNEFRSFDQWPPKERKNTSLYLDGNGSLTWQKPTAGSDSYLADPFRPNPYLADWQGSRRAPGDWLAQDQTFWTGKSDNLVYALPPLTEDLRIGGPVVADLWITTTGTDADLVVKLIDEFPPTETGMRTDGSGKTLAGYQMMVRGEIMRAKFRDSYEFPKPVVPGEPTRVKVRLNDVLHTFKKGHRILVQVQSYWFPIAERNPNVFISRTKTTDTTYRKATVSVLRGGRNASSIQLGVMPAHRTW